MAARCIGRIWQISKIMKRASEEGSNDRKRLKGASFYDFTVVDGENNDFELSNMKNKIVLIQNVATL